MKKTLLTILTVALALSLCAAWTPALAAEDTESGANYELLLPGSYEQYISLTDPTDFTLDESYIAIADKPTNTSAVIYLYSREEGIYKSYSFTESGEVTSLNLYSCDEGDYLFFVLTGNTACYISLDSFKQAVEIENFSPSVLQLLGNDVYYAIQTGGGSNIYHTTIDGLTVSSEGRRLNNSTLNTSLPSFATYGTTVYASAGTNIYRCSTDGLEEIYPTHAPVSHFAVAGGSNNDILYTADVTEGGELFYRADSTTALRSGCSVVKYYDGAFYVLSETEIIRYQLETESFDDYRIGKYYNVSDEPDDAAAGNRLGAGARDISLFGNTLLTADTSNNRILIFDTETQVYRSPIKVGYAPVLLGAGENSFIASDGYAVYLYSYDDTAPALTLDYSSFSSRIRGFTYSYGKYYIVTEGNNNAYVLDEAEALNGDANALTAGNISASPSSVTADLYGNIYVASSNTVYRFTEDTFGGGSQGNLVCTFPNTPLKIFSDYEGNLFCLTADNIYRYEKGSENTITTFSFGATLNDDAFLYSEGTLSAVSFALGYEDDAVYLLSDGFIAAASGVDVSSLNALSAEEAHNAIYGVQPGESFADGRLVTANAGTVCVDIGLSALEAARPLLDCGAYRRIAEARTGVALAETEYGVIALFYNETVENEFNVTRSYEICLLLEGSGYTFSDEAPAPEPGYAAATLSNDVGLYKYPAMRVSTPTGQEERPYTYAPFCRLASLSKGARVTVLAVLSPGDGVLDCDSYAFVRYDGADGAQYGFVPESYLIPASQAGTSGTVQFIWRNLKEGAAVTLTNISDASDELTLENGELLRVLTAPDESGTVLVSYTADGKEYRGNIDHELLVHPDSTLAISILVLVPVVAAAVLLSACYLIFRKQPTLQ